MIPITPGGLGFVEAGLTSTLTLAGVPAGEAALATLVYRLASYWLPILAGLLAYGTFWRSRQLGRPPTIRRRRGRDREGHPPREGRARDATGARRRAAPQILEVARELGAPADTSAVQPCK
jgi:hypothetical protein